MDTDPQTPVPERVPERILSGRCEPCYEAGVAMRQFASTACGATGFTTGTATIEPGDCFSYHRYGFGQAATILQGEAVFSVQGRSYRLRCYDCIHIPAGVAHKVLNASSYEQLIVLWALPTSTPIYEWVEDEFPHQDRSFGLPNSSDLEYIVRSDLAQRYELAEGAEFCDLFGRRFGAVGICGGYGKFSAGSSLPCHVHEFDESITIVSGEAVCEVSGRRYSLRDYDTAFVPRGRAHRFLNKSGSPMAMIWVYAGNEPERTVIDARYCTGALHRGEIHVQRPKHRD